MIESQEWSGELGRSEGSRRRINSNGLAHQYPSLYWRALPFTEHDDIKWPGDASVLPQAALPLLGSEFSSA